MRVSLLREQSQLRYNEIPLDLYGEEEAFDVSQEQELDAFLLEDTSTSVSDTKSVSNSIRKVSDNLTTSQSVDSHPPSYSASIAQQFSTYRQTPAQERQPYQPTQLSAIATYESSTNDTSVHDNGALARPVRPSEMKDEG